MKRSDCVTYDEEGSHCPLTHGTEHSEQQEDERGLWVRREAIER